MDTTKPVDEQKKQDIEAIREVVARVQHSQQHELVDEFLALFREDAIYTAPHGRILTGLAEIAEFTRRVLPGAMENATVTYELIDVLFIRPDVAAVKLKGQHYTLDGKPDGHPNSPLYVMSKENGKWLLTACQGTFQLYPEFDIPSRIPPAPETVEAG
ncbi:SgcJ/EcaC family oxidoreductase [Streptomyces sp. WAC07061]|uniref:SgcJ/EcaC family oxidoreductase n=1 Tax=Streptomyces sp. WAC07061 TaxID=2487410 RepID=UPI000F79C994|nr:SgcJ/EcaC family oxidoreductase [Streptomyces sp. WAC07061]RSS47436.1 SgcJ/EcaC family oxidoreductase [Streptomyces sp. WAC07061]